MMNTKRWQEWFFSFTALAGEFNITKLSWTKNPGVFRLRVLWPNGTDVSSTVLFDDNSIFSLYFSARRRDNFYLLNYFKKLKIFKVILLKNYLLEIRNVVSDDCSPIAPMAMYVYGNEIYFNADTGRDPDQDRIEKKFEFLLDSSVIAKRTLSRLNKMGRIWSRAHDRNSCQA